MLQYHKKNRQILQYRKKKKKLLNTAVLQYRVETQCHTKTNTLYVKLRANNREITTMNLLMKVKTISAEQSSNNGKNYM